MTPLLSIVMPAIRVHNWVKVYESILKTWSHTFELIIISHIPLPEELKDKPDIKWIYDNGNPTRKMQIGIVNSIGKYLTWFVDDGVYIPGKLDELYKNPGFDKTLVLKYGESVDGKSHHDIMNQDIYYMFAGHPALYLSGIPIGCKVLSFAVIPTELMKSVGGIDARFEHIAMAETDLSVRLQKLGNKANISKDIVLELTWEPGDAGIHAPVNDAQMNHDLPLFIEMYKDCEYKDRTIIDINNWKSSPEKWERRVYA